MNRWWLGHRGERYWMEITDRGDLGVDLNAPQWQGTSADHSEYWSYSLIHELRPGDVVLHYHKPHEAITAWSVASGHAYEDQVFWGAKGTSARTAGNVPVNRPGWRLGLEHFTKLPTPVTLADFRAHEADVFALRGSLEAMHGNPLYFPFVPYSGQPLRTFQGYLVKFPADLLTLFSTLEEVGTESSEAAEPVRLAPPVVAMLDEVGRAYQAADEQVLTANPDPFSRDPALVDRALRGHASTQNALAEFLRSRGIDPRSPAPREPDFDIAWTFAETRFVAEVKSLTVANEEKQLRLGLGQVLRYADLLGSAGAQVRPVLAVELEPTDPAWQELCARVGVVLVWPETFGSLPTETHDKLVDLIENA